jgi:hypothetical protein
MPSAARDNEDAKSKHVSAGFFRHKCALDPNEVNIWQIFDHHLGEVHHRTDHGVSIDAVLCIMM